jgi:hydroxymethylpyrimidine/phosphomethylpyrimidine kinase
MDDPPGRRRGTVLVIAGLDPSGGAGLLADARVIGRHGLHVAAVATGLTDQDSTRCAAMEPVDPGLLARQLARLIHDLDVRAVKVGMLADAATVKVVADSLAHAPRVPVILDPVLQSTRGVRLFASGPEALALLYDRATVITPNVDELSALSGLTVDDAATFRAAAIRLRSLGARAVLAKGGHLAPLEDEVYDLLVDDAGMLRLPGVRIHFGDGGAPRGTGCALSTELACELACGATLREAAASATRAVRERIATARAVGLGRPFLA